MCNRLRVRLKKRQCIVAMTARQVQPGRCSDRVSLDPFHMKTWIVLLHTSKYLFDGHYLCLLEMY